MFLMTGEGTFSPLSFSEAVAVPGEGLGVLQGSALPCGPPPTNPYSVHSHLSLMTSPKTQSELI